MIFNRHDNTIGRSLQHYGEWSEPETFLFTQFLTLGDVAVEAGANIGTHTVMLSQAVGDSGKVYAFEPQRHSFQLLCTNLVINQRLNVHAHQWAIGDTDGRIDFPAIAPGHDDNFGAVSLLFASQAQQTESVPVQRIDTLNLARVDFLKADVEGYEVQVLQGAMQTIERCRPILHLEYLSHYSSDSSARYFELLAPLGYRLWFFISPLYNSQNHLGNPVNLFEGLWSFDMICIPKERGLMQGLPEMLAPGETSRCTDINAWRSAQFVRP
ncbi:FkbM family methyltransferase [Comamonas testosteroni]|uniref:FkbM family methyltransferase n=1 Tax=Comamonas testosteroni TaxID=285 RepID=A0A373FFR8_COMTE|nr:FkbM family methyltransferase [Comamonas testosteroni]